DSAAIQPWRQPPHERRWISGDGRRDQAGVVHTQVNTAQPQSAARELLHVVMLVMRTVAAEMRRSRRPLAPTQMGSLMRIAAGPCTMSVVARHQAVSLPTISKSVGMLVRRGWLERCADKHDRRQSMV